MGDSASHVDTGAYVRRLIEMDKSSIPPEGGERFNRLIFSGSPYLLQHAENPVDWFPWSDEAFARAVVEDKPVFLSIGYATCHWCHVMAHESFEDREVAEVLNRHFIPVKVDREERPDIDERYMTVSRLMTGSGGWPLNVFMTPDKRPFLTVTYIPKRAQMGMPGIIDLLEKIATLWKTQRERVENNCADVMASLRQLMIPVSGALPQTDLLENAFQQLDAMHDTEWGGFGRAPKFPMPTNLSFLLGFWKSHGNPRPRAMAERTLRMLRRGGIWDQIGFGVHRYTIDREWLVPHFEKMLYDQALVATAYIDAFRATGDLLYRSVAEDIFSFVQRELTSSEGGFYSAIDADSEGVEGKYYVWTSAEVRDILGEQDGEIFCRLFGVTSGGNFEGANILHLPLPPKDFAVRQRITPESLLADIGRWREQLLAARERRIRPFRDEKIVTSWNGLMIAALADGFAITGEILYATAAERAIAFIKERLLSGNGRLMRSFHIDRALVPGFLDDYAYFVHGLVRLYEATLRQDLLDDALRLGREMLRLFRDETSGGLFDVGADAEEVLIRVLDASDNVMPSANAVAAGDFIKLGRIADDQSFIDAGETILQIFMGQATRQPAGYLRLLTEWGILKNPVVEITLAGRREAPETGVMLRAIGKRFIPNMVLRYEEGRNIATEARVCAAGSCRPPASGGDDLGILLDEIG